MYCDGSVITLPVSEAKNFTRTYMQRRMMPPTAASALNGLYDAEWSQSTTMGYCTGLADVYMKCGNDLLAQAAAEYLVSPIYVGYLYVSLPFLSRAYSTRKQATSKPITNIFGVTVQAPFHLLDYSMGFDDYTIYPPPAYQPTSDDIAMGAVLLDVCSLL